MVNSTGGSILGRSDRISTVWPNTGLTEPMDLAEKEKNYG
jgi:hypothetical protein